MKEAETSLITSKLDSGTVNVELWTVFDLGLDDVDVLLTVDRC